MHTLIYFKRGAWHETLVVGSYAHCQEQAQVERRAGRHALVREYPIRHGLPEGPHADGIRTTCPLCVINA